MVGKIVPYQQYYLGGVRVGSGGSYSLLPTPTPPRRGFSAPVPGARKKNLPLKAREAPLPKSASAQNKRDVGGNRDQYHNLTIKVGLF